MIAPQQESTSGVSIEQSIDIADSMAKIAAANLPLAPALAALADEAPRRRVARSLRRLAVEIDRGRPLEQAMSEAGLPGHLQGIIFAGVASGTLPRALMRYAEHLRFQSSIRHQMLVSTAYPAIMLGTLMVVLLGLSMLIGAPIRAMLDDFGVALPLPTRMFAALEVSAPYLALGLLAVVITMLLLRPSQWRGGWKRLPLVGPVWNWSAQAEFCQLLSLIVDENVPLPAALKLAAGGIADPEVARAAVEVAADVEQGRALGDSIAARRQFAPVLAPVLHAAQQAGALADGLETASEMFRARIRTQLGVLKIVLPPLVLILVALTAAFIVTALIFPLVDLIESLSM